MLLAKGRCVELLLPAVEKAATAEPVAAAVSPATGTETILVVEDEQGVRNLICAGLTGLGYSVLACSEPLAAIELCKEQEKIDLLVTDLILPNIDGTKLAESIKRTGPKCASCT